jgi:hypothetical protein
MKYSILAIEKDKDGDICPRVIVCEDKRALTREANEAGLRPHHDAVLANSGAWESTGGAVVYIFEKEPRKQKVVFSFSI